MFARWAVGGRASQGICPCPLACSSLLPWRLRSLPTSLRRRTFIRSSRPLWRYYWPCPQHRGRFRKHQKKVRFPILRDAAHASGSGSVQSITSWKCTAIDLSSVPAMSSPGCMEPLIPTRPRDRRHERALLESSAPNPPSPNRRPPIPCRAVAVDGKTLRVIDRLAA
jgi:hypothetical protein